MQKRHESSAIQGENLMGEVTNVSQDFGISS